MSQYILVIIWLAVIYLASHLVDVYTYEDVMGVKEKRVKIGFAIIAILPLIWWTIDRPLYFGDSDAYKSMFESLPSGLSAIPSHLEGVEKDKGFSVFSILIKCIVGNSYELYFAVLAVIQAISIALVFRRFSSHFVLSLFIFVATTDYLSWMHNGIRQFTAVALIFAATELMLKKKYIPLIAVILLASTIHGSALLMIPIVFIVQGRSWNHKTLIAIIVFVSAIVFAEEFTDWLDVLLTDTQYTDVVTDWESGNDDGTNPIRVLVYALPTLISIIGVRLIRDEKNPVIDLACNMGILSTMFYCLSVVTSGIYIGRLPIYCSLYATGILLPWELDHLFTKESSKLLKLGLIAGFLGFYYYQVHMVWGLF